MKNIVLELRIKDKESSMYDTLCTTFVTFSGDDKGSVCQCSKCNEKTPKVLLKINNIDDIRKLDGDEVAEKVESIIRKIQDKLEPNCLSENCSIYFYNDLSPHIYKRGHRIITTV